MKRIAWLLAAGLLPAGLTGCVERSYVVESNPPGAFVLVNNQPLGATPVDGQFVYYGKYRFTLMKDGYETIHVDQDIPTPWYEYWPLDFFFENLWPGKLVDKHRFCYDMTPMQVPNSADVLRRSEDLRARGQQLRQQQPPAAAGAGQGGVSPPPAPMSPVTVPPPPTAMPPVPGP